MSHPRPDRAYLADIHEAIRRILDYTRGLTYQTFLDSPMVQDAVLRNIQIIGEATKKLTETRRTAHPNVPWREMAGMRDRIVHHYFGIEWNVVWDVIQNSLPNLQPVIEAVLKQADEEATD
jgi:uncharacterized protein with HEPN domain